MDLDSEFERLTLLHVLSKFDEGYRESRRLLAIDPEHPSLHCFAGLFSMCLGRPSEQSFSHLLEARRLDPESAFVYHLMAKLHHKESQYGEAYRNSLKAVELDPENAEYQCQKGWDEWQCGMREDAMVSAQSALRLDSEFLYARDLWIWVRLKMGNLSEDDAKTEYVTLLSDDPENPLIHHRLGLIEIGRKELEEAEDSFKLAVSLDPNESAHRENIRVVHLVKKPWFTILFSPYFLLIPLRAESAKLFLVRASSIFIAAGFLLLLLRLAVGGQEGLRPLFWNWPVILALLALAALFSVHSFIPLWTKVDGHRVLVVLSRILAMLICLSAYGFVLFLHTRFPSLWYGVLYIVLMVRKLISDARLSRVSGPTG